MPVRVDVLVVDPDGADVRASTRQALLDALGVHDTALARGAHGKPHLPGAARRFNVSHTHGLGVVALADGVEVGVDVEALDGPRPRRVLPGVLSPSEHERVDAAGDPVLEFLRCWTRKEALLKAVGTGLRTDLREVSVEPAGPGTWAPSPPQAAGPWTVVDVALDGYVCAVAARSDAVAVTLRR